MFIFSAYSVVFWLTNSSLLIVAFFRVAIIIYYSPAL